MPQGELMIYAGIAVAGLGVLLLLLQLWSMRSHAQRAKDGDVHTVDHQVKRPVRRAESGDDPPNGASVCGVREKRPGGDDKTLPL